MWSGGRVAVFGERAQKAERGAPVQSHPVADIRKGKRRVRSRERLHDTQGSVDDLKGRVRPILRFRLFLHESFSLGSQK
jgi:hypothetical protein